MSDLSDFKIAKSKLEWMEPIFEKWIEYNDRYQKLHVYGRDDDDTLFFLRERPAVGILAGAAWSIERGKGNRGGYAVQEYNAIKKKKQDRRTKGYGREDLYIGINDDAIRLEAKHAWVNAHARLESRNNLTLGGKIDKVLKLATDEAKDRYEEYGVPIGGMVIAQFYALEHKDGGKPKCVIEDVVQAVEKIKADASVWYFDKKKPVLDGRHYYFGTALFISSVKS